MGLLDSITPQQSLATQQSGGLLGGAAQSMPQAMQQTTHQSSVQPQSNRDQGLKMAQQLMQSPTPQTVQMVVAELIKQGTPESKKIADILTQVQSNPEMVAKLGQTIIQNMQQGSAGAPSQEE